MHVIKSDLGTSKLGCFAQLIERCCSNILYTQLQSSYHRRCNHVVPSENRSPPVWPPWLSSTDIRQSRFSMGQSGSRTTRESAGALSTRRANKLMEIYRMSVYLVDSSSMRVTYKLIRTGYLGYYSCLLYTSPSPRDGLLSRMPSSA